MLIDVTRFGSGSRLRLAPAAIAYLDEFQSGCSIHLLGGEALRVAENRETLEERIEIASIFAGVPVMADLPQAERSAAPEPPSAAPPGADDTAPPAPRRQPPRRSRG